MTFLRLIKYDLQNGILKVWPRYLIAFALFFVACIPFYQSGLSHAEYESQAFVPFTLGDYFINILFGMDEYIFDGTNMFEFPVLWALVLLVLLYYTLNYPFRDMSSMGTHIMIASGSRKQWWLSKSIWLLLATSAYFLIGLIALTIWTVVTQGQISFSISSSIVKILDFNQELILDPPWSITSFLISSALIVAAIGMMQLLLSLLIGSVISFLATVATLFFSAYFTKGILIGNYAIAARSSAFLDGGMEPSCGITIALSIIVVTCVTGLIIINKKDILAGV